MPPLEYNYSPARFPPRPAHAAHQAPADAKDTTKPSAACPQDDNSSVRRLSKIITVIF